MCSLKALIFKALIFFHFFLLCSLTCFQFLMSYFLLGFLEALFFIFLPCSNSMSSHLLALYEFYVLFCVSYLSKHNFFFSTFTFGIIFLFSMFWISFIGFLFLVLCACFNDDFNVDFWIFFIYKRGISFLIFVGMLLKMFDF